MSSRKEWLHCVAFLGAWAVACSSSAVSTDTANTGGTHSSGEAGGTKGSEEEGGSRSAGGSTSNAGGTKAGTSNAGGGGQTGTHAGGTDATGGNPGSSAGGDASTGSTATVGRFAVTLNAITEADAYTTITGRVYDGAMPSAYVETLLKEESGCSLIKLSVPTCDDSCGAGLCVAENTCKDYPNPKSVGTVTVSGITTKDGSKTVTLMSVNKNYQVGGETKMAYPGVDEGQPITLEATGGDYSAFTLEAKGISPLTLSKDTYQLSKTSAVDLQWNAPSNSTDTRIEIELNLSHHGGSKGYVTCNVTDSGTFSVPADFVAGLIDLGVAGYPTLTVTRVSAGSVTLPPGRVVFEVSSPFSRTISVESFSSCTKDEECPSGKTCDSNVKLCK